MLPENRTQDKLYLDPKEFKTKQYFDEIIKIVNTQDEKKFIDIGCSNGSFLYNLSKKVNPSSQLIGVDLDSELVNLSNKNVEKAEFFIHDIVNKAPSSLAKSFDYVTFLGVHMCFDDLLPILINLKSFMKDNGHLILFGTFTECDYDLIARVRIPGVNHLEKGYNRHSLLSLKKAAKEVEFNNIKISKFHMKTKIDKTNDPLRSYHSYFFKDDLNNSQLRNGIEQIVTQFIVDLSR
tara:strand:+ start:92 stop:799 length:708 start_codon:yes stop_codon:yes gene_type:complete